MSDSANIPGRVRGLVAEDLPTLLAIEKASFASPWTADMLASELGVLYGWGMVVVDEEEQIAGFLLGRKYPDMWHVLDLAVGVAHRRRGFGRALVREFVAAADEAGQPQPEP